MERARTSRLLARLVEQKLVERLAPEGSPARRTLLAATEKGNDFADGGSRPIPWCRSTARRGLSCTVLSVPLRTAEWAQCRSGSASLQAAYSAG